jgi:cell wall-associated NlpC family hydrolase
VTPGALPDPRLHAYRPDLADERLKGRVEAARFVAGAPGQIIRPSVPLKARPSGMAGLENEALFGERVRVFERGDGWAWVQLERDGYVGYVPAEAIGAAVVFPTHRVHSVGTFLYPVADIKSPPLMHLSMGSEIAVQSIDDRFAQLQTGGFMIARHIAPLTRHARDFVAVAERFIGVPYLWGGRTRLGVDCSGLLQIALEAAGHKAPRDSDMQLASLGSEILVPADLEGLQRGDLVFWKGHVAMMADSVLLLHANAHHMAVAVEPLSSAVERIAKAGSAVAAIRRLKVSA